MSSHSIAILPLCALVFVATVGAMTPAELPALLPIDTTIMVDNVQVTAIKQGLVLSNQPVASSIFNTQSISRRGITALKDLSHAAPNFFVPDYGSRITSSIYVRGLGARIDQPVMGLNVDNVPVMSKDNYDMELADAERIEVLRGPQSMLYGRNTMGGVINLYTLSPLTYQGVRAGVEYSSGNTFKIRASSYNKISPNLGFSVSGYYTRSSGLFDNLATGQKSDWERMGGGRWKLQWRAKNGVRVDNTLSFSSLNQGGYPYAYIGEPIVVDAKTIINTGEIRYNDPSTYRRTTISDGLTVRYDASRFSLASITGYSYSDDRMNLDQDFLPLSYFTMSQARKEHSITQDVVFTSQKKRDPNGYRWLFGAFGFYRHSVMNAPVNFKQTGIDSLILKNANNNDPQYTYAWGDSQMLLGSKFRNPTAGFAIYHESNYTLGRWRFTAGLRLDHEMSRLKYHSSTQTSYRAMDKFSDAIYDTVVNMNLRNTLRQSFTELLPKVSILYSFDEIHNLYITVAKGYKAGGFNTQMFSDVLQQELMATFGFGSPYDVDKVVSYRPEYSWNYEFGGHFSCMEGAVRGDFALFYIDCRDQQLTVFPDGTTTGRMMTNAGRTRSYGAELTLQASPIKQVDLGLAYGYTNARFVEYDNGKEDFAGNVIPYAPANTLSANASWTIPTRVDWLGDLILRADVKCAGRIYWDEQNTRSQPFYSLLGGSVRFEHKNYSIDFWGRNLAGERYDLFYFKSMGNEFVQRGRPRTFGVSLNVNIL